MEKLAKLLAAFRAAADIHHSCHWLSQGSNSYGDHLLFERLYNSVAEEIDMLGEKIMLYGGDTFLNPNTQAAAIAAVIANCWTPDHLANSAIAVETTIEVLIREALEEATDVPGMDDFLCAASSNHETNRYLLKQRVSKVAHRWLRSH